MGIYIPIYPFLYRKEINMIKNILTRKETVEIETPLDSECRCDCCKKIIYRKKLQRKINDNEMGRILLHQKSEKEYLENNPIDVSYYVIQCGESCFNTDQYCENCYLESVKKSLEVYDRVEIVKHQTRCYYTETKGGEKDG